MLSVKRVLTGSAVGLGLAASVTVAGVGSSAANAAAVGSTLDMITVLLEENETQWAEIGTVFSGSLCTHEINPQLTTSLTFPLSFDLCAEGLYTCSRAAPTGTKAKVVFTRDSFACFRY